MHDINVNEQTTIHCPPIYPTQSPPPRLTAIACDFGKHDTSAYSVWTCSVLNNVTLDKHQVQLGTYFVSRHNCRTAAAAGIIDGTLVSWTYILDIML